MEAFKHKNKLLFDAKIMLAWKTKRAETKCRKDDEQFNGLFDVTGFRFVVQMHLNPRDFQLNV